MTTVTALQPDVVHGARRYNPIIMARRDRFTIGLLTFFALVAVTIELYFLAHHRDLVARAPTQLLAHLFSIYGLADRGYYDAVSPLALALEGINVFVMQPLCALVIYGIVRGRAWRWPLQLAVASYLAVSVVLYFTVAVVSGYVDMAEHSAKTFALLYGANAPWLVGYGWLAVDAGLTIARALAPAGSPTRKMMLRPAWRAV
ncbi:MAG TPA: emopamil-binding family protein [Polyangia bacterium]